MPNRHIPTGPYYIELAYHDINHPGGDFQVGFAAIDGFANRQDAMRLCDKIRSQSITTVLAVTHDSVQLEISVERVLEALIRRAEGLAAKTA